MRCSSRASRIVAAACVGLLLLVPSALCAQQYLFTNDNTFGTGNSTTALSVSKGGALKVLKTYPTGGKGAGPSADFASSPIAFARTLTHNCLFVSNGGDSTIAAFSINMKNGRLKAAPGSPYKDGATGDQQFGLSLAVGLNKLLFAGNSVSNDISTLAINANCSLKLLKTINTPASPDDIQVTPTGTFLVVSYLGDVDSFSINYVTGQLTELGPFQSHGSPAGIEIDCLGSMAYFGDAAAHTQVEVFKIGATGKLTEVNDFINSNGSNSSNVLLSADGKELFVSNTESRQITSLKVGLNGKLTYSSTTKLQGDAMDVLGMSLMRGGAYLFVAEENNPEQVGSLAVKADKLKEVSKSPFGVIQNGFDPAGLIAVPGRVCK